MDFRKAWLQILLAGVLVVVFIGGIMYLSALITKNTLPGNESGGRQGGYAIFSPKPKEAKIEYAKEEWVTYGGDYYNRRYSQLTDVNLGTVQDLSPAWVTDLGTVANQQALGEAAPIVVDGVMYIATGLGEVVALDAKTGEKVWRYLPKLRSVRGDNCCGRATRSVAVAEGKVFVSRYDATLVALDQKTGEVIWEKEVADAQQGYHITSAPLYYKGKIYIGVTEGKNGLAGSIMAIQAKDGRDLWTFHGIEKKYNIAGSEKGEGKRSSQEMGMTPIWNVPAVDEELDTVYFAASHTVAEPTDEDDEVRLYASLIVAISAETGEYKWHFQDENTQERSVNVTNPVVLFDVEHEGVKKKALGQAGKKGWVYLLDRQNGKPLFQNEERTVFQREDTKSTIAQSSSIEQRNVHSTTEDKGTPPYKDSGFESSLSSAFTRFWDFPRMEPPSQEGATWQPAAYSPKTEYYYVLGEREATGKIGDNRHMEDWSYVGNSKERTTSTSRDGLLTAIDVKTNQMAWQVNWQPGEYTSILATEGDILFAGKNNGKVSALHAATGQEVWSYETGASSNTPAVTYEIDGDQYISILTVENMLAGNVYRQKIHTFKLDGTWDGAAYNATARETKN